MPTPKAKFDIVADDKTAAAWKSATNNAKNFNSSLGKAFTGVASIAGVTISINQLGDALYNATQRGSSLDRLAIRMKTTVEFLSALEWQANQADQSFESLTGGLDTMAKNVSMAAQGMGKAQQALKDLQLDAKELNALPLDERLSRISNAMLGISKDTDKTRIAMQLFGDANFLSIFGDGADAVERFTTKAREAGGVLSTLSAKQLSDADTAMKQLNTTWKDLTATAATFWALKFKDWGIIPLDELEKSQKAIDDLNEKRKGLVSGQDMFKAGPFSWFGDDSRKKVDEYAASIAKVDAELEKLQLDQYNRFFAPKPKTETHDLVDPADEEAEKKAKKRAADLAYEEKWADLHITARRNDLTAMQKYYEDLDNLTKSSVERDAEALAEKLVALDEMLAEGLIKQEKYEARRLAIIEEAGLVEIDINEINSRRIVDTSKSTSLEMSEFQKNLARNTQDIIYDTLMTAFNGGKQNILEAFADMLIKMEMQALAADWTRILFGGEKTGGGGASDGLVSAGLSWLAGVTGFGGGMAGGGPLDQNKWYIAGEKGPEPIWGGGAGAFAAGYPSGGGGGNVQVTVAPVFHNMRDVTDAKMMAYASRISDATIARIKQEKRQGKL